MDGVELAKRKMNIANQTDIERLRSHAMWLLEQCWALSKGRPEADNYRVEVWGTSFSYELTWIEIECGTKDYCRGVCDSVRDHAYRQVVCGDFVVYPEEWYALSAELPPSDKDKIVQNERG